MSGKHTQELRRIATDWPACSRQDARHLFAVADAHDTLRTRVAELERWQEKLSAIDRKALMDDDYCEKLIGERDTLRSQNAALQLSNREDETRANRDVARISRECRALEARNAALREALEKLHAAVGKSGWINITPKPSERQERIDIMNAARAALALDKGEVKP